MSRSRIILIFLIAVLAIAFTISSAFLANRHVEKFTFAVFGDNRPNKPDQPQPEQFKRILAEVDALNPAFAVNTGDSIYGSSDLAQVKSQYKDYLETIKSGLRAKVHLAIGNHEIQSIQRNQDFFLKEIGALYYSFDYGNAHFIVLNADIVGQMNRITGEQMEWLKKDLYKSRAAAHKFVFIHRPLYPVDGHMGRCLDAFPQERDALHDLFAKNRITAVFVGHEHLFDYHQRNGVKYIITGGAGAFLYGSYRGTGAFHHYLTVDIDGDKVQMKMIKIAQDGKPREVTVL